MVKPVIQLRRSRVSAQQVRGCLAGLALLLLSPRVAAGQTEDCFPPKDSHEARLFAALAVPLAFSRVEAPDVVPPGQVRVGLEGTYLPDIDEETRTPTICRPGKGPENVNQLAAFPRPRAVVGLPAGFVLEGSWIPPIRLNGVKTNLVGLAVQRSFPVSRQGGAVALRIHGAFGLIRAPVVCDDEALQDPSSECFQGTRSDDRYHPNTFGAEGAVAWPVARGKVKPFLGGGFNILHPRFQVNFTNQFGETDNRRVEVNLNQGVLFGGATWLPAHNLALTGEVYSAPGDEVTGRLALSYTLRAAP